MRTWFGNSQRVRRGRHGRQDSQGRLALERLEDRLLLAAGINEFGYLSPNAGPFGIVAGPDGNLWFTETAANQIGRIGLDGTLAEFPLPTPASSPVGITAGPDGNLWFTETAANQIGTITPAGLVTEFAIPTPGSQPSDITPGPDGNLWFTETAGNQIGTVTPAGLVTEFSVPTAGSQPLAITPGPDGDLWFTEAAANQIGTITPAGQVTEYPIPTAGSQPSGITTGPDGNLWFTETAANQIGTITPAGQVSEIPLPTANSQPFGITADSATSLWFTETAAGQIGQITLDDQVTEAATPTPASQPLGIALGPDENLWFTEFQGSQIGQVVPNAALTTVAESARAVEGTSFQGEVATFRDSVNPNGQPGDYSARIQWGDGSTTAGTIVALGGGQFSVQGAYTYAEEGTYAVTVRVSYADGSSPAVDHGTAAVDDAPLTAQGTSLSAVEGGAFSGSVASFSDGNPGAGADEFSALIDWGDGQTSAGTIQANSDGTFSVLGHHLYADEGSFTIAVSIADIGGSLATATTPVVIADAPLTVTGTTLQSVEGMAVSGTVASFTDPNPYAGVNEFTAMIRWGDGTTSAGVIILQDVGDRPGKAKFSVLGSHTYADEGSYQVTVTILDVGGATVMAASAAAIADAPLTPAGTTIQSVEGTAFSGLLATFTDANPNAQATEFTATIRWGDGQTSTGAVTANGHGGFDITGAHTYADEGSYTISIAIADAGGSMATATAPAAIADAPLTATGSTVRGVEGAAVSGVLASFTDANPNAQATEFTATIRWGDGQTSAGTVAANTHGGFDINGSHTYTDEGSDTITITITDAGGSTAMATSPATIADAPLTAAGVTLRATEGAVLTGLLATFTDANPNPQLAEFTATITWGDNSSSAGIITSDGHGGFQVTGTHTYSDEGSYAASVTIRDAGGAMTTAASPATVADAALTATGSNVTAVAEVPFSGVVASFTDANPAGTAGDFTAQITWGDNQSSAGSITADGHGGFTVTGTHPYPQAGTFNVRVNITDRGGSLANTMSTASVSPVFGVQIQSPAAGLVTNHNITITGQITGPVAVVGSLQAQMDSGAFVSVSFDAAGNFSYATTLALDGSANGTHTVHIRATDQSGTVTKTAQVSFQLDTHAPLVTVADAGGTFNSQPFPARGTATGVTGGPVNGTFAYTYYVGPTPTGTGSPTPPTNAGTYTVIAAFTSSDPNYHNGQSGPVTFTITPARPTVTATDAGGTYTSQPFPARGTATGVTGASVNGTFAFTYYVGPTPTGTGSPTPPTNAGTYTVVAAFTSTDANYSNAPSGPVTFTITPARPTVTATDAGGEFNGQPFPASATAKGVNNVSVNGHFTFTYYVGPTPTGTGSPTPPTNVGTYTVVAAFTSSDTNYTNGQSSPVTFTIVPGTLTTYDIGSWSTLQVANLDGQSGQDIFTTNGTTITVLSARTGTITHYDVGPWSTLALADLGGTAGKVIYTLSGSRITVLNPRRASQPVMVFNIGPWTTLQAAVLDGPSGQVLFATSGTNVIVLNVSNGTTRTYNVGAWSTLQVANLDGQSGQEIFTTSGTNVTVLNVRAGTVTSYNMGPWTTLALASVDSQSSKVIYTTSGSKVTVLNLRVSNPVKVFNLSPWNTLEAQILDSQAGKVLFTTSGGSITVLNVNNGTTSTYNIGAWSTLAPADLGSQANKFIYATSGTRITVLNLHANTPVMTFNIGSWTTVEPALLNAQTGQVLFATNGGTITVLNVSNGSTSTYNVGAWTSLQLASLGVGSDKVIYTLAGSVITVLNIHATRPVMTFNIGSWSTLEAQVLDPSSGQVLFATSGTNVIVLNVSNGTTRTYNVGAWTTLAVANLDGTGQEIYTTAGTRVTVLNVHAGTVTNYDIGAWNTLAVADLYGLPGQEIFTTNGSKITVLRVT